MPAVAPRAPRARYLPIAEHGLIGDLHTVALVGTDGTIDRYCCRGSTRCADYYRIDAARDRAKVVVRGIALHRGLGIKHVWMHRGPGAGSVSKTGTEYGRGRGIRVIDGGCPCMFDPTADLGHRAMCFLFTLTGNVPKEVSGSSEVRHERYEYKVIDTGKHVEEQLTELGAEG